MSHPTPSSTRSIKLTTNPLPDRQPGDDSTAPHRQPHRPNTQRHPSQHKGRDREVQHISEEFESQRRRLLADLFRPDFPLFPALLGQSLHLFLFLLHTLFLVVLVLRVADRRGHDVSSLWDGLVGEQAEEFEAGTDSRGVQPYKPELVRLQIHPRRRLRPKHLQPIHWRHVQQRQALHHAKQAHARLAQDIEPRVKRPPATLRWLGGRPIERPGAGEGFEEAEEAQPATGDVQVVLKLAESRLGGDVDGDGGGGEEVGYKDGEGGEDHKGRLEETEKFLETGCLRRLAECFDEAVRISQHPVATIPEIEKHSRLSLSSPLKGFQSHLPLSTPDATN